jgi:hypothetical protein
LPLHLAHPESSVVPEVSNGSHRGLVFGTGDVNAND